MSNYKKELAGSADYWQLLNEVNLNNRLSFAEHQVLRDAADARLDALLRRFDHRRELEQFQTACNHLVHSIQDSLLALRVSRLDREQRQQVREAYDYQLAHLSACLQRAFEQP
jgi:hypothetical protein